MKNKITRRDFINGAAVALAGIATLPVKNVLAFGQDEKLPTITALPEDYYPPTLTGILGNHNGAFETSHNLAWRGIKPSNYTDLDEAYDLVVGAGISGLAAASLYQQKVGKQARILLLDNHDDFGGHAKRNEFHSQGRMLLTSSAS